MTDDTMTDENGCPGCGRPVAADLLGLCPDCLLKAGLDAATMRDGGGGAFSPPAVADLAPLFPDLEILEPLGRGGMGVVYKARQKRLDRLVALKILPPTAGRTANFGDRFEREAQALARLSHPNIVAVHDSGETGGIYYFVMEYVEGVNLRQLLRDGRLTPEQALAVVPQICAALQFAHDHGIVHRDIKPENILIDKAGRVKIGDFGLAKILGRGSGGVRLTAAGTRMGTPHYMAPEQTERPALVDHRADIYSLGVVLYEMLTGELPLGRFAPPSRRVELDVRLDEVVLKALEKEPDRRYQQASQVEEDVQQIAATPGGIAAGAAPAAALAAAGAGAGGSGPAAVWGGEYKSDRTLWGWPLAHFAFGIDPATGRARAARGILAIGDRATGVIALGSVARGVLACGGLAQGVFAFGGLAVGVCAWGGLAVGLLAFGGLALALAIAYGGGAVGPVAVGGWAAGWYGAGGAGWCRYFAGIDPEAGFLTGWLRALFASPTRAFMVPVVWAAVLTAIMLWGMWVASRTVAGRRLPPVAAWLPVAGALMLGLGVSVPLSNRAAGPAAAVPPGRDVGPGAAAFAAACAAKAERFARQCRDGEFERATGDFARVMAGALPPAKLRELFAQLGGAGGKITGIGAVRAESIADFLLVYVPVRWERNALDLKVVFDREGKVAGLWTMAPGTKQAGAQPVALPTPTPGAPAVPAAPEPPPDPEPLPATGG